MANILSRQNVGETLAVSQNFAAIDIGGTNTRIAIFETLARAEYRVVARFLTESDYARQMQRIFAEMQGVPSLAGIGVSIGARIARDGRSVVFGPNVPDYIGEPFAQDLEDRFGCPVRLGHDTVCGLLGEQKFGCLQFDERCAYLTVSTGTGAAIHLQKAGLQLTISIEIGHQILDGNTHHCLCGQIGCLETFTGGKQLELQLGKSLQEVTDPLFWENYSEKLAIGLINLTQLTKIETVSVSGGIMLSHPELLQRVQQHVNTRLTSTTLTLHMATLGENAPLVGAALLLETAEETILH